jgi:hypothetical protein
VSRSPQTGNLDPNRRDLFSSETRAPHIVYNPKANGLVSRALEKFPSIRFWAVQTESTAPSFLQIA